MNVCNDENNVPTLLSPQLLFGNSCTWAHDVPTWMMYVQSNLFQRPPL